ncbi:Rho/RAC guanine nucleotide exchange factor, putative [Entamoeba invadens IP1]|uniref:Rho/RAC guanine nucleotide exchange factor, putative n=1 Tax=Entamoeba invadens IP1 TaxID=370355 RepID=A0A0A1U152_ENTIV|nr:Rho/RAC guanine nucleotide exchange factor, putative [Entamoeba invadens IP1]ELP84638.1 Rho/RAC guanine nucleotide exchange factor, putative [Entamoeba invadens IP1]|eukprot:XP_004183984.1 Rho/RAC guanine nucleotide exchange factor, putative [Entamoeba invadens IP1]
MKKTQRERIVDEIYTTEQSYVSSMDRCVEFYKKRLEQSPSLISREDVGIIFEHFEEILAINKQFARILEDSFKKGELPYKVGEIFKKFIPFFKSYFLYISHYETSNKTLAEYEKRDKFYQTLEEISLFPNTLDLRSYLIMPVQRLPRYRLLLSDLLKHTENTFVDYTNISDAVEMIKTVTMDVNERAKEIDMRAKVFKASKSILGLRDLDLNDEPRELVKEGDLIKVCRNGNKPRYFYLFNDVLIYGIGTIKIVVSGWIYTRHITLEEDIRFQHAFCIKNDVKSFTVICVDDGEKQSWLTTLQRVSDASRKKFGGDKFITKTDMTKTSAKYCPLCHSLFSLTNRKHRCEKCYKWVCGNCSKGKIPMPPKNELERVCDVCFSLITGNSMKEEPKPVSRSQSATCDDPLNFLDFDQKGESNPCTRKRRYSQYKKDGFLSELGMKDVKKGKEENLQTLLDTTPRDKITEKNQQTLFFDFVTSEQKETDKITEEYLTVKALDKNKTNETLPQLDKIIFLTPSNKSNTSNTTIQRTSLPSKQLSKPPSKTIDSQASKTSKTQQQHSPRLDTPIALKQNIHFETSSTLFDTKQSHLQRQSLPLGRSQEFAQQINGGFVPQKNNLPIPMKISQRSQDNDTVLFDGLKFLMNDFISKSPSSKEKGSSVTPTL